MALPDLTPRQRAALVLHDLLGWDAADVAELLDTDVESVDRLLAAARSSDDENGRRVAERRST